MLLNHRNTKARQSLTFDALQCFTHIEKDQHVHFNTWNQEPHHIRTATYGAMIPRGKHEVVTKQEAFAILEVADLHAARRIRFRKDDRCIEVSIDHPKNKLTLTYKVAFTLELGWPVFTVDIPLSLIASKPFGVWQEFVCAEVDRAMKLGEAALRAKLAV